MTLEEFKKLDLKYGDILHVCDVIKFVEKNFALPEDVIEYYGHFCSLYPDLESNKNILIICARKIGLSSIDTYKIDLAKVIFINKYIKDK
jgi:hypothetical protein